jgi:amino acid transporter
LSAGVLVTAGFAFNETFVYWFPNFAFAFLVLAVVAIFHLFGYRAAERMQTTSLTIVLGGLVVLVAAGFRQPEQSAVIELGGASETIPTLLSGALLLFVGCDLHMHRFDQMSAGRTMSHSIIGSIVFTTFLMGLWGTVSLMHVSAERLSESFIPFTLAARQIGGQAGRAIMGAVVIAGTGCAVVTLFSAASQLVTAMAGQQLLPRFLMGTKRKNITATIIWTTVVAALMAFGFTGSPSFEVFIRAGFMLWMLHMVVVQLMSARRRHVRTTQTAEVPWHLRFSWTSIPTALLFIAGAGYLWMMDPQRILLTVYLAAVWGGGVLLLLIAQRAQRPKRSTIQKQ